VTASVSAPVSSLRADTAEHRRRDITFLPLHVVLVALVVLLSLGAIGVSIYEPPESHRLIAIATGATAAGLIAYARYFLRLPWLSAPVVYLVLFWTFHFGMTFTAVLFPSVLAKISDQDLSWFFYPSTRLAMLVSLVGAASFVLAIGFFTRRGRALQPLTPISSDNEPALYIMGWLLQLAGTALVVVVLAQNGGLAVFSMDVLEFRATVMTETLLPTAIDVATFGCLLVVCGASLRQWPWALVVWGIGIATPMMLVGQRSSALVPLATYAAVLAHRGVRLRLGVITAVVLGVLFAIPAVRIYRDVGFANRDLVDWTDVTPLDTFMELGGSLQATRAYIDWIEAGDPLLWGASYWAPFDRQILGRLIPWREPIPYEQDERVPLRLMVEREAALGGSATGEAYYNFGPFGPVIYFAGLGVLFGLLQRFDGSAYGSAMLGASILPLYFNIRSDWLSMPAQIGQGLVVIAICYFVGRIVFTQPLSGSRQSVRLDLPAAGRSAVHDGR